MGLVQLKRGAPGRRSLPKSAPSTDPLFGTGDRPRCRTLIVELPFKTFSRPSIGLSLLKATLGEAGYACSLRYANLEFAALIGVDTYRTIAEEVPEPLLLGDLVFAPALDDRRGHFEALRDRGPLFLADGSPLGQAPNWLWQRLPELQRQAAAFAARLAEELAHTDADLVGFSCMFQTLPSLAVARMLKAHAPQKRIVFGGSHCEGEMGLALHEAYPFIDFVGRGESERLIVDLAASLSGEGPGPDAIPGLLWREAGVLRRAGDRAERIDDLDALPIPVYDDWFAQLRAALPTLPAHDLELPFETSRGCWYGEKHHCTFCGLNGESMAFRSKSPARVLEELRGLARHDIPFVYAVDLILDHRYFDTLLPSLAEEAFTHTLFFETKSNLTRRQVQLLRDARIRLIQPGIESLSTPVLTLMRKGVTACQNVRLLKWAAEFGIGVFWNLLYGFPGESAEEYRELARLLPALSHLMPPLGGYKVRVDRFSPLYFDAAALGVGATRPAPAYAEVHGLPADLIERLAYHFEPVADERSFDYMQPVAAALQHWHEVVGQSSFVSLTREHTLHLFDRRPLYRAQPAAGDADTTVTTATTASLEGLEREVYLACDAGATAGAIATAAGVPESQVRGILDGFVERRWVVQLDGRFLGLAVPLDEAVPGGLPVSVLAPMCHALYVKRLLSLGRFVLRDEVPPRPVGGV